MPAIWKSGCKTEALVVRLGSEQRTILALKEHHILCTTCVYLVSSQSRQDTFLLGKLQLEDVDNTSSCEDNQGRTCDRWVWMIKTTIVAWEKTRNNHSIALLTLRSVLATVVAANLSGIE
jgi:hypothetical protein